MREISILSDNRVATSRPRGLRGEWGFAAAVDDVLFDTGQTGLVVDNAARMDVEFDFDAIVLSHAHYDHTGGLPDVLARLEEPTVYCHPSVWTSRYGEDDGEYHHIGLPYARSEIATEATIVEHTEPVEVSPGVHALGEIPRPHPEATVGLVEKGLQMREDPVRDDQALALETDDGIALVMGCGHAGLRNTIEHAESTLGDEVRYVVGGTHLVAFEEDAVRELADWLEGRLHLFGGTHCTGATAERIFAERLPAAFESVGVGSVLRLG